MRLMLSATDLRRFGTTLTAVASMLLLLVGGCTQGPEEDASQPTGDVELPEWLDSVSPPPGAEAAPIDIIEVQHNATDANAGVRMIIDGTDVTASAIGGEDPAQGEPIDPQDEHPFDNQGLLSYDPNTDLAPVSIEPGDHTVVLERVRLPEEGAQLEVLDTFEWSFTVQ